MEYRNQRRYTLTTPAGRKRLLDLDSPVMFGYDAVGRLTEVAQGTGLDRRMRGFGYDAAGWLDSLTDPMSRSLAFDRDAAPIREGSRTGWRYSGYREKNDYRVRVVIFEN